MCFLDVHMSELTPHTSCEKKCVRVRERDYEWLSACRFTVEGSPGRPEAAADRCDAEGTCKLWGSLLILAFVSGLSSSAARVAGGRPSSGTRVAAEANA